ncbi:hypothetical protein ACPCJU_11345 [Streptomyces thermodiastaticus]|jgi:hypothetical protein
MRVQCSPQGLAAYSHIPGNSFLKEGKEYVVLEVFSPYNRPAEFRLEPIEGEEPALFDCRFFTVTSSSIPPTWRYFLLEGGSFFLYPEPWRRIGFWEDFYDHVPEAVRTYNSEKRSILAYS